MTRHTPTNRLQSLSPVTVQVEHAGRRFPSPPNLGKHGARFPVSRLNERPEDAHLPQELTQAIRERLPWYGVSCQTSTRQEIVQAYVQSVSLLTQFKSDVDRLIQAACRANLEFRQLRGETNTDAKHTALDKKLAHMLKLASKKWAPVENILSAELVSQPIADLFQQLRDSLDRACREFCREFFTLLAQLVDRRLFGLVEWHPNNCCSYHFFHTVVIQENKGRAADRVVEQQFLPENAHKSRNRVVGKRTRYKTKAHGKHHYRLARHEHEVMNAIRTSIANSKVVIPAHIARMLRQVPDWLSPFVEVIDGDIFRERIIECDTGKEAWADVSVQDEPIYGTEPGIIIGPYVLAGWGPREVEEEQRRRRLALQRAETKAVTARASKLAPVLTAAAGILAIAALLLAARFGHGLSGMLPTLVATAAAAGLAWYSVYNWCLTGRIFDHALALSHLFSGAFLCVLLCLQSLFLLTSVPWGIPLLLAFAGACFVIFASRILHAAPVE